MRKVDDCWVNFDGVAAALLQADLEAQAVRTVWVEPAPEIVTVEALCEYILSPKRTTEKVIVGTMDLLGLSVNAAGRITEAYAERANQPLLVRNDTTSRVVSGARSATPHYMAGLSIALAAFRAALAGEGHYEVKRDAGILYRCFCVKVLL